MYQIPNDAEKKLQTVLDEYTSSGRECGCQLSVWHQGKPVIELVSGHTSFDRSEPVKPNTLFPMFSAGKGVMATAFLRLLAAGKADLADPVCRWWPEFTGGGKENVQIWQLLCHRAGMYLLPAYSAPEELADWELMCRRLESAPCRSTKMRYHAITFAWLIGELAHRITGHNFYDLIRNEVLRPLDLTAEIRFGLTDEEFAEAAQLDNSDASDPGSEKFIQNPLLRRSFIPSANGFASARAIAKHYAALLESGAGNVRLLPMEWVELATTPRRGVDDPRNENNRWVNFGLGYALCGNDASGGGTCFGHSGAAGAEGFADKTRQLAVGFTKNRPLATHPRHPIRDEISKILEIPPRFW